MQVRTLMSARKIFTVNLNDSYETIVKLLVKQKISGVPVVNKKGKVVGIVSEKDLFYKLFPSQKVFYKDPEYYMNLDRIESEAVVVRKIKAKDIMSRKVIFIGPDDHVLKACSLFIKHNIRRLPVIEKGKLVGIVTTNNVYKHFLKKVIKKR